MALIHSIQDLSFENLNNFLDPFILKLISNFKIKFKVMKYFIFIWASFLFSCFLFLLGLPSITGVTLCIFFVYFDLFTSTVLLFC